MHSPNPDFRSTDGVDAPPLRGGCPLRATVRQAAPFSAADHSLEVLRSPEGRQILGIDAVEVVLDSLVPSRLRPPDQPRPTVHRLRREHLDYVPPLLSGDRLPVLEPPQAAHAAVSVQSPLLGLHLPKRHTDVIEDRRDLVDVSIRPRQHERLLRRVEVLEVILEVVAFHDLSVVIGWLDSSIPIIGQPLNATLP